MTKKKTPSENIDKDQDNLMNTLESIRSLLAQNEGKLTAARESISIANTNTKNDTSALHNMRNNDNQEEIVPILDDIVETDSLDNIPELDSIFDLSEIEEEIEIKDDDFSPLNTKPRPDIFTNTKTLEPDLPDTNTIITSTSETEPLETTQTETNVIEPSPESNSSIDSKSDTPHLKPDLATLTAKNLLLDALDDLQIDMEESLRETLMRAMVTLEKELKEKITTKIKKIKTDIYK